MRKRPDMDERRQIIAEHIASLKAVLRVSSTNCISELSTVRTPFTEMPSLSQQVV
jgi:hypothetical protein